MEKLTRLRPVFREAGTIPAGHASGITDGAAAVVVTSSAFALYAVGLVAMGLVFLFVRAFAARLDTKRPVVISVIAFFLNVGLNLLLVRTPLRHAGLALASSLAYAVHAVILYLVLNRDLARRGAPISGSDLLSVAWRVLVACGVLALVLLPVDWWLGMRLAELLSAGRILRIVLAGGAGGAAYLFVSRLLGLHEVTDLITRGRRRDR